VGWLVKAINLISATRSQIILIPCAADVHICPFQTLFLIFPDYAFILETQVEQDIFDRLLGKNPQMNGGLPLAVGFFIA